MPRIPKAPGDRTARINGVTVLFNADERALVARVASAYGISNGAAVRMMMLKGAPAYDPNDPRSTTD